ncbi:hypothetical protein [Nocardia sp. NPDC059691]|uniref:hypothetical protein n=1 Tax=Nocardia sp. NPDC059691 TaxID=3346908 RepID=UPI003688DA77
MRVHSRYRRRLTDHAVGGRAVEIRAFSPDVHVALAGSVELAMELGVASDEILDSDEKVDAYFLD